MPAMRAGRLGRMRLVLPWMAALAAAADPAAETNLVDDTPWPSGAVLQVVADGVSVPVSNPRLSFRGGDSLPFFGRDNGTFFGVMTNGGEYPVPVALESLSAAPAWAVDRSGRIVFVGRARSARGKLRLENAERLVVREVRGDERRVELQRSGRTVMLDIPAGLDGLEIPVPPGGRLESLVDTNAAAVSTPASFPDPVLCAPGRGSPGSTGGASVTGGAPPAVASEAPGSCSAGCAARERSALEPFHAHLGALAALLALLLAGRGARCG